MSARLALFALVLVAATVALAPAASAHATTLQEFPPRDAQLAQSPSAIWAVFSEPLDPTLVSVTLLDPDLNPVAIPAPQVLADRVTVPLSTPLHEGGYIVKWEVVDAVDGHPVGGTWAFAVGQASVPQGQVAAGGVFSWTLAASKYVGYAGLAVVAGAVVARSYLLDPDVRAPLERRLRLLGLAGAGVLVFAACAYFLFQSRLVGVAPLAYARTLFGRTLVLRLGIALGVLAWFALARPAPPRGWGALVDAACVVLASLSYGMAGHTSGEFQAFALGTLVATVHVGSTMAWTGGLAFLALVMRAEEIDPRKLKVASRRFSSLATLCIVLMAGSGLVMMWGALGPDIATWAARLATPYGALLAAMIVLGAAMMALGGGNRFRHMKAFLDAPDNARRRRFRSRLSREACVGVVVLVVAAGVSNLSPPAAAEEYQSLTAAKITAACVASAEPQSCRIELLQQIQATRGIDAAFDVLSRLPLGNDTTQDHAAGHALGRDNYLRYGDIHAALRGCPTIVFQACLHGTIQEYFTLIANVTPGLVQDVCPPQANAFDRDSCAHGIGHGLELFTGYALDRSLELCDALNETNDRLSCYHGVFMENSNAYTLALAGNATAATRAWQDPKDLSFPCDAVNRSYRQECWVFQPLLILPQIGWNASRVAQVCETIPTEDNASAACYTGIGGYFSADNGYAPSAMGGCGLMPTTLGHRICIIGFVATAIENNDGPAAGLPVCRGAPPGDRSMCYSTLGVEARRMLSPTDAANVCAKAISSYVATCRAGAGL